MPARTFSVTTFESAPIETVIVTGVLVAVCFVMMAKTPDDEPAPKVIFGGTVASEEPEVMVRGAPALPAGVRSLTVATLLLLPMTPAGARVTLKIGG